jgi:hypothetical protein
MGIKVRSKLSSCYKFIDLPYSNHAFRDLSASENMKIKKTLRWQGFFAETD